MSKRTRTHLYLLLGLSVVTSGAAAADRAAPTTLRMRAPGRAASAPPSAPVRLAYAPPEDEDEVPSADDDAPVDDAAPAGPSAPPDAPAPPAPPANVGETPNLSDEELMRIAEEEAAKEPDEIIYITGSTLERRELTTTAPVTVVDRTDLEAAGVATVGDILQDLPAQSNGINAQSNNGGDGSTRVDIRGLGAERTLVLLNGRRIVPGGLGADSSVDLNAIPLAVIERVEVLKDGASALYGSDAIGGVVNVITRDDFQGTEASLYTGGSQRGDGFNYDMSFVTGQSSKKGNVIVSAGWQHQDPVFAGDRGFSEYDREWDFDETEPYIGGSYATPNGILIEESVDADRDGMPDNANEVCGASLCKPDGNGGWVPFVDPDDLYNYQPDNYLFTPSQRYNVFAKGHYDLTDHAKVFFEALYLNRQSDQQLAPTPFYGGDMGIVISADSMYNDVGGDVLDFYRRLTEFGPRRSFQNVDTYRLVTGLGGQLPSDLPLFKDWKWEVSYNYGRTVGLDQNEGNLIKSRLANALGPSFMGDDGPACGTPDAVIDGCVPINILGGAGSIDPAQRDYVTFTGVSTGYNEQRTALAHVGGQLAKLPNNGDVSLALGADYREESGGFTPDPLTSTGDTTGNAQQPTDGTYNVVEGFGELSVVPISGHAIAKWAEVNLAARGFRYDSFGSGVTWKAGALFKTVGGVSVRGTYSTAFRAPSVSELYQGNTDDFQLAEDPCDGTPTDPVTIERCAEQGVPADATLPGDQQRAVVGGNPELDAETANVITAGVVYEPPQVQGLSLTVDYFNVEIQDAIQAFGAAVILNNCYTRDQDEACALVHRNPVLHTIDYIDDSLSNVGGTRTDGVDFAIAYEHAPSVGQFRHQFEGQYLHKYDLEDAAQVLKGAGYYDIGPFPKFKANFSTTWEHRDYNAGLNVRYIGSFKACRDDDCNTNAGLDEFSEQDVDANVTADVFAGYALKSDAGVTHLTVGVNNLTDQDPSLIYNGFAGDSDSSTYDYMGRFFYARMTQQF